MACTNIVSNLVIDREIIPPREEILSESQEITDTLSRVVRGNMGHFLGFLKMHL